MMPNLPISSLFLSLTILTPPLMISSSSWTTMWVMMEINMLMFLPLMTPAMNSIIESMVKYLLIQSATSSSILLSALIMSSTHLNTHPLLLLATLTKLGAAPLHTWMIMMIKPLNWPSFFLILTWQKIIPLAVLFSQLQPSNHQLLSNTAMVTALWGALAGLNQSLTRIILTYSSIAHISWMISASFLTPSFMILYTATYFVILAPLYPSLTSTLKTHFWMPTNTQTNQTTKLPMFLSLLSLAGLPPLLGFFTKWLILANLIPMYHLLSTILILSSMISLIFYLTLSMHSFFLTKPSSHLNTTPTPLLLLLSNTPLLALIPLIS